MDRYSVVIPTLWKSNRIHKLLRDLIKCEAVDEILLIDNAGSYFEHYEALHKVKLIQTPENIYVNPAWNLGISLAKNDCIALCNDDINFNPTIFEVVDKSVLSQFGIIGQSADNYIQASTGKLTIELWNGVDVRDWGWGCLVLMNKKDWIDIPHSIKIWYGDDFIFKCNTATKAKIKNFSIQTEMSTTSDRKEWDSVKKSDYEYFMKYLRYGKTTS
jgi:glycosyltransferase involved in cell wall biosynthesis